MLYLDWSYYYEYFPDHVFHDVYKEEWFDDPFVIEMIKGVDDTEHDRGRWFNSPYLGLIPADELSNGVKNLILAYKYFPSPVEYAGAFAGPNCFPYIKRIAEEKDIYLHLLHDFEYFERLLPFKGRVSGKLLTTMDDAYMDFYEYNTCLED